MFRISVDEPGNLEVFSCMKTPLTYMKASTSSGVGERRHSVIALVGRALYSFFVTRDETAGRNRLLYARGYKYNHFHPWVEKVPFTWRLSGKKNEYN